MKILVTGGAGFIGSHIVDHLIARGDEAVVLDDLSAGFRSNLPDNVQLHELDIRSSEAAMLVREGGFEVMIHLAAQMSVAVSTSKPGFDAEVNIGGLLNLMEAARASGTVKKVLFSSTGGAMYDDSVPWPTPEEVVARPLSPYGIAKLSSEMYLRYYWLTYGIPYTALRLGNVYGPRQNPHGEAGVIAIFAKNMIEGKPVRINGDGKQTRDYVFVEDVARAFVAALGQDAVESINVGTSIETNVLTIYNELAKALKVNRPADHFPARPGEVRRSCLQNKKAAELLNWSPSVSLSDGMGRTAEFFRHKAENPDAR
ncbi:NAD-dependent epimerase/dehydratase family protein [bacterium]|nr:NAD-dependent epimerase/dehydratase family protein [bacterium]